MGPPLGLVPEVRAAGWPHPGLPSKRTTSPVQSLWGGWRSVIGVLLVWCFRLLEEWSGSGPPHRNSSRDTDIPEGLRR